MGKAQLTFTAIIWFIVFSIAMVLKADAQSIEFVRPADFRYHVVVGGDTLSSRSLDYKAIQDGLMYKCEYPELDVVVQPIGLEVRGECPVTYEYDMVPVDQPPDTVYADTLTVFETVVDTVYADTTTVPVYSVAQPDHNTLFKNIEWDLEKLNESIGITFFIETSEPSVDTLYTEVRCGNEWVENNIFVQPAEMLTYGLIWDCNSPLTYQFKATNELGWEETITNSYPLWMSTFGTPTQEPSSSYELLWGNMTWTISDGVLDMELPERSIARITDENVPVHNNIQVLVTEVVDTSHSTGVHLAMRTSEVDRQHSVETYLNNNGMGVSIFTDGSWSNPVNFPVEWEYGVPITYTVTLVDDTLTVETGGEVYTYTSEVIGNTPSGVLSIGSTGAGRYIINDINVLVLD